MLHRLVVGLVAVLMSVGVASATQQLTKEQQVERCKQIEIIAKQYGIVIHDGQCGIVNDKAKKDHK